MLLSPYLQKKLDGNTPLDDINEILINTNNNDIFRYFILDCVVHSKNLKGYEKPEINDAILTIANNSTESSYLRRNVLLNLIGENSFKRQRRSQSEIIGIFKDESVSPEVRGAAITAMHRTCDPNFNYAIQEVFKDYNEFPPKTVQYAVIEAAKTKNNQDIYIPILTKIAAETDDEELYGSTIFSIGICGGTEAVKSIINNYGRFEEEPLCNSALKRNYKPILSMLDVNQSKDILLCGISAAESAGITPAIESLEIISVNTQDEEIKEKSLKAIEYIKSNPSSENYEKMED